MDYLSENLVEKFVDGSEEAFTVIYNEHIFSLLNFAQSLLPNRVDAEDICSDVFIRLWQMRDRFNNIRNIKAFLFISVRNACLNFLRSAKLKRERETIQLEDLDLLSFIDEPTDIKSEYKARLRQEIDRLPDQCQRIFKLSFYEDLTNKEIAAYLNISIKTVTNQKARALQLLRIGQKLLVNTGNIAFILYILSR